MKKITMSLFAVLLLMMASQDTQAGNDKKSRPRGSEQEIAKTTAAPQFRRYLQGFDIQMWLSNLGTLGRYAWLDSPPNGFGLEYPQNSGIDHLFGAGPWIGAVVDTSRTPIPRIIRVVSTAYEGWSGPLQEMFGNPDGRDSFYLTNVDGPVGEPRKRKFDDDGDGKVDEDELDGYDNDGDWNPATDDLGVDGRADVDEEGCEGSYDPVNNPDPNHDNLDSSMVDRCVNRGDLQTDRNEYTQGNGLPNHGEPRVDEDYGAISESDAYVSYSDIYGNPSPIQGHVPLGVKIWQRSYAWRSRIKEPILPLEITFVNVGRYTLDSVYVGFFADCDVGPVAVGGYFGRNSAGYMQDVRTAFVQNTIDRPSTPVGLTVLDVGAKSIDSVKYTFQWYAGGDSPTPDRTRYAFMSSGIIKPDEYPSYSDTRMFFSFGPVTRGASTKVAPGDSVKIAVAVISGEGLTDGPNNLRDNAAKALELYRRGWTTRPVPPAAPLRVTKGDDRVTLDWRWRQGDPKCDPIQTWDDSDKFVGALPDTHWRRRNPELRCSDLLEPNPTGGRIFEGFRVWRSESPTYNSRSFALLRQYDMADDLNFEYGTGLEYSLIDSGLVRGRTYWYAVTAFSTPGISLVEVPIDSVTTRIDTLISPPTESDFSENLVKVVLPFKPGEELGTVKVVPNPYRSDVDYTYEGGGWEGLSRQWTESKRVIWFIHLPSKCTIRIFTLTGDLVNTIEHDDAVRAASSDRPIGQEEWNLISTSGRAIASGIYVYAVESDFGRQVGKFVVIR